MGGSNLTQGQTNYM